MDAPTIAAFASLFMALVAVIALASPVYLRLGRLEGEVTATRERSGAQYAEAKERSDAQYRELLERHRELKEWAEGEFRESRERSEAQYRELREWAEGQFRESRERSEVQHAETLAEIRRLTDALVSHSHADGGIIFHIPPPPVPPRQE